MKTKITYLAGIALVAAFVLVAWQCTKKPTQKRRIAVSIANLAQVALLQGDSCISLAELWKMRTADAMLSSTTYQYETFSLGGCCPCPPEIEHTDSCQCDAVEESRQYAALRSWSPQLSFVGTSSDVAEIPPFKEEREGKLIFYKMPALKPGGYLFRISAAFDNKNSKTYDVKVNVNKSGQLIW